MFAITACELITGSQARWLASGDGAPELRATYERLRELVPPVEEDRALGPAVTAVVSALRNGFPHGPGSPARAESPNA